MNRLWEIILGLDRGFLNREGEFRFSFNPDWPLQNWLGAGVWNFALACLALALVVYVYRRDGRSRNVRVALAILRTLLLAFILVLLNRPVLTLGQSRTEPSVLAVMIDESVSMRIRDANVSAGSATQPASAIPRIDAVKQLLTEWDHRLLDRLEQTHQLRLYTFAGNARPLVARNADSSPSTAPSTRPGGSEAPGTLTSVNLTTAVARLEAEGQTTQVARSIRQVLDDLQGQRLAGIVILTDGRDTPAQPIAATLALLKDAGTPLYPVPIGSERAPQNLLVQSVQTQEAAFKGDIVNVRATVRAQGAKPESPATIRLLDRKSGARLNGPDGRPVERSLSLESDKPTEVELQFKPETVGALELLVEIENQPGELDEQDNSRSVQISVLDATLNVLYVDGYPRWEYRYLKTQLIRDRTVMISCLLTSADPSFRQEGDRPITRFPETMEELMEYDVVLLGDVDPRQFSDSQLMMISDFVSQRGGGFGLISGPRHAPQAYRGTAIESLLPVNFSRVQTEEGRGALTTGWRPVLTREGQASSIFRFLPDRQANERYLAEDWQVLFWFCRGVTVKPGVGEVYAEHPTDIAPDGQRTPLIVFGRFGAGRTFFSGIDDTWRWRYYTGENVFDTFWIQTIRQLARSKKLGQRKFTFVSDRPNYELGEQVRLSLRVLDSQLLPQLPPQVRVEIKDDEARLVRVETLVRADDSSGVYEASFTADRSGRFSAELSSLVSGSETQTVPIEVVVPRLELAQPQVDRVSLARLASETGGQLVDATVAAGELPTMIPSAARIIPLESSQPLWDAPLALVIFVLLICTEWVARKMYGMV